MKKDLEQYRRFTMYKIRVLDILCFQVYKEMIVITPELSECLFKEHN